MSKEGFKVFARNHPELISSVMSDKITWQKLYELYDIYGDDEEVWSKYINTTSVRDISFKDLFSSIKNIDIDNVQKGIENLQKTIGLIQGIGVGDRSLDTRYKPKEEYRRMDD